MSVSNTHIDIISYATLHGVTTLQLAKNFIEVDIIKKIMCT